MHEANWLGAKSGKGFYVWEDGRVKIGDDDKPVMNLEVLGLVGSSLPELAKLG